jgi:hypothetical protein
MNFKLRLIKWIEGKLECVDHWFASLEEAIKHAIEREYHAIKVFFNDVIIHEHRKHDPQDPYA